MSDAASEAHSDPLDDAPHSQPSLLRDRLLLSEVIQLIVRDRCTMVEALAVSELCEDTAPGLQARLEDELRTLAVHNCARFRLTLREAQSWLDAGRPV